MSRVVSIRDNDSVFKIYLLDKIVSFISDHAHHLGLTSRRKHLGVRPHSVKYNLRASKKKQGMCPLWFQGVVDQGMMLE